MPRRRCRSRPGAASAPSSAGRGWSDARACVLLNCPPTKGCPGLDLLRLPRSLNVQAAHVQGPIMMFDLRQGFRMSAWRSARAQTGDRVTWLERLQWPEVNVAGKQAGDRVPTQGGKARSDINDVARLARVSRQIVSNVLNNRTGYSEETRNRVLAAIEALDYQPHRAARSLRSQRTMPLGYQMPSEQLASENAFVLGFIQALVRAAADNGHHVLVFTEQGDVLEVFRELVAIRGVDGFILSGSRGDDPRAHYLHQAGMPFAVFGRTAPGLPQTWVDAEVLRLRGRRHRPAAIVTGSDVLAAVAVNAAKSLGLRVGQDVAVTGFDGGFVQQMTEPMLTSVRIPVDRIAAELIACCLREIDEGPTATAGVLVPTEIAVGGSA